MPYTRKLIENRPAAGNAASNIRKVLRELPTQTMDDELRTRVEKALTDALDVLMASVDYNDDGQILGVVGEYEHLPLKPKSWGCRRLNLEHHWQTSEFSDHKYCTKCGEPQSEVMVGGKDKTKIRNATPVEFRDVLIAIARSASGGN